MRIKRKIKHIYQILTRGWTDSDTWDMSKTVSENLLPRVKELKKLKDGHPANMREEEWDEILDKIIWSLEETVNETEYNRILDTHMSKDASLTSIEKYLIETEENMDRVQDGFRLLGEHYTSLWW